jgi:hypothetical protein
MKTLVRLLACAAVLITVQSLASAQPRRGFACTDMDVCTVTGHRVYRIDLDNPGATIEMGTTNVPEELEGFFSINDRLFGVSETPDGCGRQSVLVDLTAAAVNPNGLGTIICNIGPSFGTEAGAAWSHLTGVAYAVFSDDQAPARTLFTRINPLTCAATAIAVTMTLHVDGLAVGGDGTLYATDARNTDSLYRFNFSTNQWVHIGPLLAENFSEDSGLGNYSAGGTGTELNMITEGDGARLARLWRINHLTGQATLVGNITFPGGAEVPEDLEGFDIPRQLLAGE